jgi:hypothetical protein
MQNFSVENLNNGKYENNDELMIGYSQELCYEIIERKISEKDSVDCDHVYLYTPRVENDHWCEDKLEDFLGLKEYSGSEINDVEELLLASRVQVAETLEPILDKILTEVKLFTKLLNGIDSIVFKTDIVDKYMTEAIIEDGIVYVDVKILNAQETLEDLDFNLIAIFFSLFLVAITNAVGVEKEYDRELHKKLYDAIGFKPYINEVGILEVGDETPLVDIYCSLLEKCCEIENYDMLPKKFYVKDIEQNVQFRLIDSTQRDILGWKEIARIG